jgi:hypothetical protein
MALLERLPRLGLTGLDEGNQFNRIKDQVEVEVVLVA